MARSETRASPEAEGGSESPLGPFFAEAADEGYRRSQGGEPVPFHGYYYRLLEKQGRNGPGGARSYVDASGLMTGGFAAIAWPAKYGNSGVMTFFVNHVGVVYEKDLGSRTEDIAPSLDAFDPDDTWTPARQ